MRNEAEQFSLDSAWFLGHFGTFSIYFEYVQSIWRLNTDWMTYFQKRLKKEVCADYLTELL